MKHIFAHLLQNRGKKRSKIGNRLQRKSLEFQNKIFSKQAEKAVWKVNSGLRKMNQAPKKTKNKITLSAVC